MENSTTSRIFSQRLFYAYTLLVHQGFRALFCKALDMKILDFRTFLPDSLLIFKNLLAFQQAWLLAGKSQAAYDGTDKDHRLYLAILLPNLLFTLKPVVGKREQLRNQFTRYKEKYRLVWFDERI